jgi:hypothetical protein
VQTCRRRASPSATSLHRQARDVCVQHQRPTLRRAQPGPRPPAPRVSARAAGHYLVGRRPCRRAAADRRQPAVARQTPPAAHATLPHPRPRERTYRHRRPPAARRGEALLHAVCASPESPVIACSRLAHQACGVGGVEGVEAARAAGGWAASSTAQSGGRARARASRHRGRATPALDQDTREARPRSTRPAARAASGSARALSESDGDDTATTRPRRPVP